MKVGNLTIKWRYNNLKDGIPMARVEHFYTFCFIENNENKTFVGAAFCNPKDNFCRATGRKLSLARAMKNAQLPKEARTVIWEIYRNSAPNKRW